MHRIVFWLVYPLLWIISILPFPVFYFISDIVFIFVYYLIGYRKKTVTDNLQLVFPEKNLKEIAKIRKNFYHHMCDMFLEMIKSISISEAELKKRFIFKNPEKFKELKKLNKGIIVMCGHYASYEWMIALQVSGVDYQTYGIYKKIKNPYFDNLVKKIRSRFKSELIPTFEVSHKIPKIVKSGELGVYAMIADQSPKRATKAHWIHFMGERVPVFMGSEFLARRLDLAVVYLHVEKVKRGHYEATFKTITDFPNEEPEFNITQKYISFLEQQIKNDPQYYLWTHKRWKHKKKPIDSKSIVIN